MGAHSLNSSPFYFPWKPSVTTVPLPVMAIRYLSVSWGKYPLPSVRTEEGVFHTSAGIAPHLALIGLCPFLNQTLWTGSSMVTFPHLESALPKPQGQRVQSSEFLQENQDATTRGRRKRKQEVSLRESHRQSSLGPH